MARWPRIAALLALLLAAPAAEAAAAGGNGTTAAPPKAAPAKPRTAATKEAAVQPAAPAPGAPRLRLAVEGSYPPFSELDAKGRLKGFDVDIANALCAELAVRCELVQRPWAVLQDAVIGLEPRLWSEVDAIVASVSITETRRQTADFTRRYYQVPARFLRRKGSPVEPVAGRLKGRRIAVQASTTHDQFVTATFAGEAEVVRFETLPLAVAALAEGRVDLVMGDALALDKGALKTQQGAGLELCGPSYTDPRWFGYGAGIVVRKGNRELVERLDAALDALRAKGEHARIAKAYFGFDIDPR
jgi:arginine/ornithine transport system substrate-binding protein